MPKRLLAILLFFAALTAQSYAIASEQDNALQRLFAEPAPTAINPARHSFVFWINGAADHFVTQSSGSTANSPIDSILYRGDSIEEIRIEKFASDCPACNVIILHVQRGGAHWYTANKPWATYLRVFSRGKELLQRHVNRVDQTDPRLLTTLLEFSQAAFPLSELHLIYRGHSFREPYQPGSKIIAPFDYSNAQHGYSEDVFVNSIQQTRLSRPLSSITLASCSMASLELAAKLAQSAHYLVSSEVDVLEVLDVTFRFAFLNQVTDAMDARHVSYLIANRVLEGNKAKVNAEDLLMEEPMTWVDLQGMKIISEKWNSIVKAVHELTKEDRAIFYLYAMAQARLAKTPSNQFIDGLRQSGVAEEQVQMILAQLKIVSEDLADLDLGQLLDLISSLPETADIAPIASELRKLIQGYIRLIDSPASSTKLGLSINLRLSRNLTWGLPVLY